MNAIPSYDLQHLGFARFAPPQALAPYVQCYWVIRRGMHPSPLTEKLYPDGGSGLIFNFGSPYSIDQSRVVSHLMYQGAGDQPEAIGLDGRIDAIGIRFRPAGAYSILGGIPARELQKSWQPLEQLLPGTAHYLFEQLAETPGLRPRLRLLNRWLFSRLGLFERQQMSVLPFINATSAAGEPFEMDTLLSQTGFSRRKLERLFTLQAGFAPARLSRLLQVSRARESLKADFLTPLTQVGQACGFYDQPHFIRHFKAVMKVTPGQYRKHKMAQRYNS